MLVSVSQCTGPSPTYPRSVLSRPALSSYSMLQTRETATMEVMTGINTKVRKMLMPLIWRLNSTASSRARITPVGTVSTANQRVLSSEVMNWSSVNKPT